MLHAYVPFLKCMFCMLNKLIFKNNYREETCCKTAETSSKDVRKNSFTENEAHLDDEISWEMKRASLELRQIMGDFKPKVLFPIYRKDLPSNYIAYYELKIEQSQRQSYAVISAGMLLEWGPDNVIICV